MKKAGYLLTILILLSLVIKCTCDGCEDRNGIVIAPPPTADIPEIEKIHFYLENSGSMDGYVSEGYTDFEKAIADLITNLVSKAKIDGDSIKIFLANSEQYLWDNSNQNFLEELTQQGIPKIGKVAESDINRIFENVLDNTLNNQVSVLVTDAIYSVEPEACENLIGLLDIKGRFTGNSFLERIRKSNLSTLMIKLESLFSGYYYPAEGGSVLINQPRPYYMWLFGESYHLKDLYDKLQIQNLPGYQNDQFFLKIEKFDLPYSILEYGEESGIIGKYQATDSRQYPIHSITFDSRANFGENEGEFGFGVLVDLSQVPLPEKYLTDPSNYYSSSEEYKVYKILNREEIQDPNTLKDITNQESQTNNHFTHVVYVKTNRRFVQQMTIGIRNQISQWIYESSNDCDSNINGDTKTTFGLKQLSSGIIKAYEETSPSPEIISLEIAIKV